MCGSLLRAIGRAYKRQLAAEEAAAKAEQEKRRLLEEELNTGDEEADEPTEER